MTPREIVLLGTALAAGAAVGSFLNVIIARLPRELDEPNQFGELWETNPWATVAGGDSHCEQCGRSLTARDLVPILSWLVLRGRCRTCGARIHVHHLVVEAAVPLLGLLAWLQLGVGWQLAQVLWLIPPGAAIAVIDLRTLMVPTRIVWPATALAALISVGAAVADADVGLVVGAAVGSATLAGPLAVLWFLMPAGMGFGDVRLAVLVGWTVGFQSGGASGDAAILAMATLLGASVVGLVLGVVVIGARGMRAKVPFGPALLIAGYAFCLVSPEFLDAFHG